METSTSASQPSKLVLPSAPASETGSVKAWQEPVQMKTYPPCAADVHPMFLDKRVYQGSSGKVYPLPVIDRVASEPVMQIWDAIHLENEYLRVMVLPQIGGRIHVGYDKTNGYDFFYRQNVIKPALVGLAGPWLSGGVEFNWPQHHRPNTFMPVDTFIERDEDGSVTVWCSQQDALSHLKGMHGVCLRPGRAVVELRVRLYNATEQTQTFLWWANVATRVHEKYQSFFPPDVRYVADHARRAITAYPHSDRPYYGVDYAQRAIEGVPEHEQPQHFRPEGSYAADDLGWYANIPVPTSYMITSSAGDFLGGYDHAADAGLVHVANHHISPGKKQWTWGNHEFGYSWDRALTDDDGPYIELMAGVYTDNQPDFSWLAPGEGRSFEQYWYPIRRIGVPQAANVSAAMSLRVEGAKVHVGVCVTADCEDALVVLDAAGREIASWKQAISVGDPLVAEITLPQGVVESDLCLTLYAGEEEILFYAPGEVIAAPSLEVATEPAAPEEIASNDELYLTGLHLQQYRHATRSPEPYWREALRRDAGDARCHVAIGGWHLRRGEFVQAEEHFRAAIQRLTLRNANPYDGEASYQLGVTLRHQERWEEAYAAFYKSTWNAAWRTPAFYALAAMDAREGKWASVLAHTQKCLQAEAQHLQARCLRVVAYRAVGNGSAAQRLLDETLSYDALYGWAQYLASGAVPAVGQDRLDLVFDLIRTGLWGDALRVLQHPYAPTENNGAGPMLLYALARVHRALGDHKRAEETAQQSASARPDYCFPNRLDEMTLLEKTLREHPEDHRAAFYLGTMFYDRERYEEAIALWERTPADDACYSIAQRNLGIAYFNVRHDKAAALRAYENAFAANPRSGRLLYERDQLWKRAGVFAEERLRAFEEHRDLIGQRDDLSVELATLYNQRNQSERALEVLQRTFQPWEGGEGLVLAQFERAQILIAKKLLAHGNAYGAVAALETALTPPHHLGETFHLLANRSELFYRLGQAYSAAGEADRAQHFYTLAASKQGDFQNMAVSEVSNNTYWSALALNALGRSDEANTLFAKIAEHARTMQQKPAKIDYFATSLPTLLLFHEDIQARKNRQAALLLAQANVGLGNIAEAKMQLGELLKEDPNQMDALGLMQALS
ncbi:MAG: DUF5107 domain-containing protein [Acidobacteria bacterium]|nr:DUF5107 domain-containing protein [Acidobacteriota bacterium]